MNKNERPVLAAFIACVIACACCAAVVALHDSQEVPAPDTTTEPTQPPMADGLKPCPRCGGKAAERGDWVQSWCQCGECGFRTPARLNAGDARALWNSCEYYGRPYAGATDDE